MKDLKDKEAAENLSENTQQIIEELLEKSRILREKNEKLVAELNRSKTNPAILWPKD